MTSHRWGLRSQKVLSHTHPLETPSDAFKNLTWSLRSIAFQISDRRVIRIIRGCSCFPNLQFEFSQSRPEKRSRAGHHQGPESVKWAIHRAREKIADSLPQGVESGA
jgi:hypothetical protein